MIALVLITLAKIEHAHQPHLIDRVEIIELNYVWDNHETDVTFTQCIFWDETGHVIDWRWHRKRTYYRKNGQHHLLFQDREATRHIVARYYVETGSNYDRETAERERLHHAKRRKLLPLTAPTPTLALP